MDTRSPEHPPKHDLAPGADVIQLEPDWTSLRGTAPLAQVEAYWYALRGNRLVPHRSEVDPRGIEGALGHAFIIERIAPGHSRIRIAGTHVADLMGMEVRGMPLSALFEPVARAKLQSAMRCLFDDPAIYKFTLSSAARIGKPGLKGQLALYPLRNDTGEIARALGCLVTEGDVGRAPRRFDLVQTRREVLTAKDLSQGADEQSESRTDRNFELPAPVTPKMVEAAEAPAEFISTAVPWLRIVPGKES